MRSSKKYRDCFSSSFRRHASKERRRDIAKGVNMTRWQPPTRKMLDNIFHSLITLSSHKLKEIAKMAQIKASNPSSPSSSSAQWPSSEPEPERIPCPHESEKGHTEVTCIQCHKQLDTDFDNVLRGCMHQEAWTEGQIEALGFLRRFDKTPFAELVPDPLLFVVGQRRAWGFNLRNELQAGLYGMRAIHAARDENGKKD
jgi:hypothetical protein